MDEEQLSRLASHLEIGLDTAYPTLHCAVRPHMETGGDVPVPVLILEVRTAEGRTRFQAVRTLMYEESNANVNGLVQIIGESLERLSQRRPSA